MALPESDMFFPKCLSKLRRESRDRELDERLRHLPIITVLQRAFQSIHPGETFRINGSDFGKGPQHIRRV